MKRYNPKGKPTKEELVHMSRVAELPCIVTDQNDVQIHHITEAGRRLGNFWVLPLSVEAHRRIYVFPFKEQMVMCKEVYRRLGLEWKEPPSKVVARKTID